MYIEPYEVLERIRLVAYHLALPLSLFRVHNVFHVSQLRNCIADLNVVLKANQLKVQPNLTILERL